MTRSMRCLGRSSKREPAFAEYFLPVVGRNLDSGHDLIWTLISHMVRTIREISTFHPGFVTPLPDLKTRRLPPILSGNFVTTIYSPLSTGDCGRITLWGNKPTIISIWLSDIPFDHLYRFNGGAQ